MAEEIKTHYPDKRELRILKDKGILNYTGFRMFTFCQKSARLITNMQGNLVTTDKEKVTCKKCLNKL